MAPPLIISLNGADNVGKTTQISLLPPHHSIRILGSLHHVEGKLKSLAETGCLKDWWWTCSDEEFVLTIFEAVQKRHVSASAEGDTGQFWIGAYACLKLSVSLQ